MRFTASRGKFGDGLGRTTGRGDPVRRTSDARSEYDDAFSVPGTAETRRGITDVLYHRIHKVDGLESPQREEGNMEAVG
jgi:hypothetical protein